MTTKKFKVGVVGLGFIGPAHIENIRRLGDEVVGIAGATFEEAKTNATLLKIRKAYANYEEMVADSEIEIIHICSPNFLHFEHSVMALNAGKHVICEKPLTITSQESATLVALSKEKDLACAVNYNLRYYPVNFEAKSIVQSGELGKIHNIHGVYLQDWLLYPTDWNWRLLPKEGGSLCSVADIGSHWMDMIRFVTGLEVVEVFADLGTAIPVRKRPLGKTETFQGKMKVEQKFEEIHVTADDFANILFHFDNGAKGNLAISQVSAGRKNCLQYEIDGSESAIAWNSETPGNLWRGYRGRYNEILMKDPAIMSESAQGVSSYPGGHAEGFPDTFKQLTNHFNHYIEADDFDTKPGYPTFEDGHKALLIEDAILESTKTKTWVKVKY